MPMITSVNVAQAIIKLVAVEGLPALMNAMVMGSLVNRDFEPLLANSGDTVNVPIPAVLSANNIAEGGSVTTQNPSLGNAQITLNMHAESTFQIPDVTKALASVDILKMYMQPALIAVAEKIETDIFNLYTNLTANSNLGTAATALTETTIDSAETALFTAKVPEAEPKYLVVSGAGYGDLRQISRFTESRTLGSGGAIVTGKIGDIKNFHVFRSQLVAKPSTTTYNLAFARDALGLVTRRLPQPLPGTGAIAEYAELANFGMRIVMSYAPGTLSQQFTVDCLYGVGVLRNVFGQVVLS